MELPILSNIQEGPYTELIFPSHDVYSTIVQTSRHGTGARKADASLATRELNANNITLSEDNGRRNPDIMTESKSTYEKSVIRPCPLDWHLFKSKCYYCSTERKSWTDSQQDCNKQNANLVILNNKEEQEFITKHTMDDYWIGLRGPKRDGTWLWANGTPLPKDKGFGGNIYHLFHNENCAMVSHGMNKWETTPCNYLWIYVCEKNALQLS
ncbi:hypothetical protein JZ751_017153 [Albula glossodonta]|uniref:C-type lectin domain-containing protein n=1 Tax=Albula glossodonta TaxID=121402 RepID=A0A8T2MLX6_9TELE|nr:hypothetical protein JZ751_005325 [Albula glossodonta]KAG9342153.1 hypothetical protein JZ751_017153 [Albula glossodonta]